MKVKRWKPWDVWPARVRVVRGPDAQGRWYVRAEVPGCRATPPTSKAEHVWSDWAASQAEAAEMVRRVLEGVVEGRKRRTSTPATESSGAIERFSELLRAWLAHVEDTKTLSPATIYSYRSHVRRLINDASPKAREGNTGRHPGRRHQVSVRLGPLRVHDVDERRVVEYRRASLAAGDSPSTVRLDMVVAEMACTWAASEGILRRRLAIEIPPRQLLRTRRVPSDAEIERVVQQLSGWRRDFAQLVAWTGMRIGEAANLQARDVWISVEGEEIRGRLNLRVSKTGPRAVFLDARGAELVARLAEGLRPEDGLWGVGVETARRWTLSWSEACEAAEVQRITMHALRRAFACRWRKLVDVVTLAKHLGHSPEQLVKDYALLDEVEVEETMREGSRKAAVRRVGKVGRVIQLRRW